ncbi:MAG: TusE/DsrC/DsvC family sulfur relay protein [Gammaproteobacteria bacterium]|nr:MAG: TusE/DsrC/DsvC family sulfur relay protein [Gammaproteobacteria bacterium]
MNLQVNVLRDNEGYLVNPEDWDEEVARELAAEEGIELDERYWPILRFMRSYWEENRVAPDVRHVVDFLVGTGNFDKKSAKQHLFELFPYGYVKQACKLAGMQRPRAWSTG